MIDVYIFPVRNFIGIGNRIVREKILAITFIVDNVGRLRNEIIACYLELRSPLIAEIDTRAPRIRISITSRSATGASAISTPIALYAAHTTHTADEVIEGISL